MRLPPVHSRMENSPRQSAPHNRYWVMSSKADGMLEMLLWRRWRRAACDELFP
jgi:hypothetical protein